MIMYKKDIAEKMAEKTGISKKKSEEIIDAFLDIVKETLAAGDNVQFTGFGMFSAKYVEEKTRKIPLIGSEKVIPAHRRASFAPGKALKDAVNR